MNNHTHHHNGSIVLKVTATITVIFLVAITLNQIILNRHINDTIEENMEETVLRTAEQTENYALKIFFSCAVLQKRKRILDRNWCPGSMRSWENI